MSVQFLALFGATILVPLVIYAVHLGSKLSLQRRQQSSTIESFEIQKEADDKDARQSIQIIARALLQNDLSRTEAAMRIAFLSQKVKATSDEEELFSIFHQLAEATAHIPILEDWSSLERTEKKRLTTDREQIEEKYIEFVSVGAEALAKLSLN